MKVASYLCLRHARVCRCGACRRVPTCEPLGLFGLLRHELRQRGIERARQSLERLVDRRLTLVTTTDPEEFVRAYLSDPNNDPGGPAA